MIRPETATAVRSILEPTEVDSFRGNWAEALDAMVGYAAIFRAEHGVKAWEIIADRLERGEQRRVAQVAATALLRLADERAGGSQ